MWSSSEKVKIIASWQHLRIPPAVETSVLQLTVLGDISKFGIAVQALSQSLCSLKV